MYMFTWWLRKNHRNPSSIKCKRRRVHFDENNQNQEKKNNQFVLLDKNEILQS